MALAADGHDVTVLTDVTRRAAIEIALDLRSTCSDKRLPSFEFYRPWLLSKVRLNRRTAQMLYSGWQYALLLPAMRLHRKRRFELVLHVTYGVFRHPSFLGFLDAPFVFGPVGGGEEAPWRLKTQMPAREKLKELARSFLNIVARVNPLLNLALAKTDLVLAKTAYTADALPRHVRGRTHVMLEIGLDSATLGTKIVASKPRSLDEPFQVMFAGRLIGVKGIDLLLESFARFAETRPQARLVIIGSGPLAGWVDELSHSLGIGGQIAVTPHLTQPELFARYSEAHALLFPSLHDSSGNVVLEALHHALPVVCLDLGGPPDIIDATSGFAIDTRDVSRETVIERLAEALGTLHDDEPSRRMMSDAAVARAATWSWRSRVRDALAASAAAGLFGDLETLVHLDERADDTVPDDTRKPDPSD